MASDSSPTSFQASVPSVSIAQPSPGAEHWYFPEHSKFFLAPGTFAPVVFFPSLPLGWAALHFPCFILNWTFPGHSLPLRFCLLPHLIDFLLTYFFTVNFFTFVWKWSSPCVIGQFSKFICFGLRCKAIYSLFFKSIVLTMASPGVQSYPDFQQG